MSKMYGFGETITIVSPSDTHSVSPVATVLMFIVWLSRQTALVTQERSLSGQLATINAQKIMSFRSTNENKF